MTPEQREQLRQLVLKGKEQGLTDDQLRAVVERFSSRAVDPERERISGYEATGGVPAEPVAAETSALGAALRNLMPAMLSSNLGAGLAALSAPETFDELQKLAAVNDAARQAQHPVASAAGGIAGVIPQAIALGSIAPGAFAPSAVKGAGWASRALSSILPGAAQGAIHGLGTQIEPLDDPMAALGATLGGGAVGGVAAPVMSAVGSGIGNLGHAAYSRFAASPIGRSRSVQNLAAGMARLAPTLQDPNNILKHANQSPNIPGMPWTPGTATAFKNLPVGRELTEQGLRATAGSPRAYAAVVPTLKAAEKAGRIEAERFVDSLAGPMAERPFVSPAAARSDIMKALAKTQGALTEQGKVIYGPTAGQTLRPPALDPEADPIFKAILREVVDFPQDPKSLSIDSGIERSLARAALSETKRRIGALETAQKAGQSMDTSVRPYQRVRDALMAIMPDDEAALNAAYSEAAIPKSTLVSATKGLLGAPDTALGATVGGISPSELLAIQQAGALRAGGSPAARMAGLALANKGETGGFSSLARALQDAQTRETGFGQNIRSLLPPSMSPQLRQAAGASRIADIAGRGIQNVPGGGLTTGSVPGKQAAEAAINIASGRESIGLSNLLRSVLGIDPAVSAERAAEDIARVVFTPEGFKALAEAVGLNNARALMQSLVQQSTGPAAAAASKTVIEGVQ